MALKQRSWKAEGLIHHSDRGVQYASAEYTTPLDNNEIQISMSRCGNPYDNARSERFMRTLKEEEVHDATYQNLGDARKRIARFIEEVYNPTATPFRVTISHTGRVRAAQPGSRK
jgi:putative transposase